MPGRKEHVAVVAIASPPVCVAPAAASEWLAVQAGNGVEGVFIVRREVLDALKRFDELVSLRHGEFEDVFAFSDCHRK